ncbi:MAG: ABC transporter permease [Bacteroidales bacterium]|nr:ABC transporter permease [Bacteroidales bacterium]
MRLELFMAHRLVHGANNKVSTSVVKIAIASVALSVAVMIVSMAVIIGFKNEIMDKVVGFGSCINIVNRESSANLETLPISSQQDFYPSIENENGISHIQRFVIKPAIFKAGQDISGVVLKGVGSEYDWSFFQRNLLEGNVLTSDDTSSQRQILISKKMSDLLKLKVGDNLVAYFIQDPPRMRKYYISGIYSTGLEEYDKTFAMVDIRDLQKLNGWKEDQITGFEVMIDDFNRLDEMTELVRDFAGYKILDDGSMMKVASVKDNNHALFDWITLTEMNVWVILAIMFFVAFVNMSTALLIIIFEKASMIGLLKAIGSTNWLIRKIFILQSLYILLKGIIIGNIIALLIILAQHFGHLIPLDASSYYVDHVPCDLQFWYFVAIDFATILVMSVMLVIPSFAISKMQPAKVIGFK